MNMVFPLMVKEPADKKAGIDGAYIPFNSLQFIINVNSNLIYKACTYDGEAIRKLESVDGITVSIDNLKCHSYEELIVSFQLHNLFHSIEEIDICSNSNAKLASNTKLATSEEVLSLRKENAMLKSKIANLKKTLRSVKNTLEDIK